MTNTEIKRTWRKLIIQLAIGLVVLTTAILFHRLGSKRPGPQVLWFFAGVFGAVFTLFPGINILKFRQYVKNRKEIDNGEFKAPKTETR